MWLPWLLDTVEHSLVIRMHIFKELGSKYFMHSKENYDDHMMDLLDTKAILCISNKTFLSALVNYSLAI